MWRAWPTWAAAVGSGVLLALCFPPWNQTWLIWVALVPLSAAVLLGRRPVRRVWLWGAGLGYTTGLIFFWCAFFWLSTVTGIGWFLLCFYLALYPAFWGAVMAVATCGPGEGERGSLPMFPKWRLPVAWLRSRHNLAVALVGAAAWTGQEWLRGIVFTGFGWNGLGIALHGNLPLIQIADLTGVGGISFMLAFVNIMIVLSAGRFLLEIGSQRITPHYDFTLTLALVALVFVYGVRTLDPDGPYETMRVVVVQPDIKQEDKWNSDQAEWIRQTYLDLTLQAAAMEPDLIVWPEAATPGPVFIDPESRYLIEEVAAAGDFNFVFGSLDFELAPPVTEGGEPRQLAYNVAVMVNRERQMFQMYQKLHLVPFGEFVPLRQSFPLFAWVVGDLIPSDFDAGSEATLFEMTGPDLLLAPLICFEDTVGRVVRRFCEGGAQVLVNITNDGWFLESSGSHHHLINSIFRCVETRRPMVRAANTGVSCMIDVSGRITAKLQDQEGGTFVRGLLSGRIEAPLEPRETVYLRYGEWFSVSMLAWSLVWAGVAAVAGRRKP